MTLNSPFAISPRLSAAVKIGDGWLSHDSSGFVLDGPWGEYQVTGFRPGMGSCLQSQFGAILSFLGAAAESFRYRGLNWDNVTDDDNATLFRRDIVEWAYQHSDEISMLSFEIEESESELIAP